MPRGDPDSPGAIRARRCRERRRDGLAVIPPTTVDEAVLLAMEKAGLICATNADDRNGWAEAARIILETFAGRELADADDGQSCNALRHETLEPAMNDVADEMPQREEGTELDARLRRAMTSSLEKRLRRLERGHHDEASEIVPGVWMTAEEVDAMLKEVNRRSTELPNKRGPFNSDGR